MTEPERPDWEDEDWMNAVVEHFSDKPAVPTEQPKQEARPASPAPTRGQQQVHPSSATKENVVDLGSRRKSVKDDRDVPF